MLLVTRGGSGGAETHFKEVVRPESDADIERVLVDEVSSLHGAWCAVG